MKIHRIAILALLVFVSSIGIVSADSLPRVAVDSESNIYVLDGIHNNVRKYDSAGNFIHKWGSGGEGKGQFDLADITVNMKGIVYVADFNGLQKLDPSGQWLSCWKWEKDAEPGDRKFIPDQIAVDAQDNVYAVDSYRCAVRKYSPTGELLKSWGSKGTGKGQFDAPAGVAIGSDGSIYIADSDNYRIQKFDSSGNYVAEWGSWGKESGQFMTPYDIAVDSQGNLYITDPEAGRIQKFDSSGKFIAEYKPEIDLYIPYGIAVDASGNVYVSDSVGDLSYNRIIKCNSAGKVINRWEIDITEKSGLSPEDEKDMMYLPPSIMNIAVDADGNIYATHGDRNCVRKYDPSGKLILQWGWKATGWFSQKGQFDMIAAGIAVDNKGRVLVVDAGIGGDIQVFDSTGKYLFDLKVKYEAPGSGPLRSYPGLVSVDEDGNVYSLDGSCEEVLKWNPKGEYAGSWRTGNKEQGEFGFLPGFAADKAGNIYLSDPAANCVRRFDSSGKNAIKWGSRGAEAGQFKTPLGIAVDKDGNVYVADSVNKRIQKFKSSGEFIAKWKSYGEGNGEYSMPALVAVDANANVYVLDLFSTRLWKFDSTGEYIGAIDLK